MYRESENVFLVVVLNLAAKLCVLFSYKYAQQNSVYTDTVEVGIVNVINL